MCIRDRPKPRTYQNNNQGTNNVNTGYQEGRTYPRNNGPNNTHNVNNTNFNDNNNTCLLYTSITRIMKISVCFHYCRECIDSFSFKKCLIRLTLVLLISMAKR